MTMTTDRPSAKIIQFPVRARTGATNGVLDLRQQPKIAVNFGAWYHDAAIEEEQRPAN